MDSVRGGFCFFARTDDRVPMLPFIFAGRYCE
jgi:hypothetical protein